MKLCCRDLADDSMIQNVNVMNTPAEVEIFIANMLVYITLCNFLYGWLVKFKPIEFHGIG